jgi:hypothetical protein
LFQSRKALILLTKLFVPIILIIPSYYFLFQLF